MERTTLPSRLDWWAGEIAETAVETPRVTTLQIDVPNWTGHRPGQHVDVRVTTEDGNQAVRSYSIASAPRRGRIELAVERMDDGEVSAYLSERIRPGDGLEFHGPLGGHFVWDPAMEEPLMLVAAGSGIAPIMSIIRARAAAGSRVPTRLIYSSRSFEEIIYRRELEQLAAEDPTLEVVHTLTRQQPPEWAGYGRRIDRAMLEELAWPAELEPRIYICGSSSFVESVSTRFLELGHAASRIKPERFGPTGVKAG